MRASNNLIAVVLLLPVVLLAGCQTQGSPAVPAIEGRIVLPYDHAWRENPNLTFRLAIMVKASDGNDIEDFFADTPVHPDASRIVGTGSVRQTVPRLFHKEVKELDADFFEACAAPEKLPPYDRMYRNIECFYHAFPEYRQGDFELTFQEFHDGRYRLEGMPDGIAIVWIQTLFDGNRVTQLPLVVRFPDASERALPFDIECDETRVLFHTL